MDCLSRKDAGESPPFPPEHDSAEEAKEELLSVVRRDPWPLAGQTRWTLEAIREQCAHWLRLETDAGLWRLLDRLGITYKRGRHYTYSPDPDYQDQTTKKSATISRRPSIRSAKSRSAGCFSIKTNAATIASRPWQKTTRRKEKAFSPERILPTILKTNIVLQDVSTQWMDGCIFDRPSLRQAESISTDELIELYRQVAQAYSEAETIYIVQVTSFKTTGRYTSTPI